MSMRPSCVKPLFAIFLHFFDRQKQAIIYQILANATLALLHAQAMPGST